MADSPTSVPFLALDKEWDDFLWCAFQDDIEGWERENTPANRDCFELAMEEAWRWWTQESKTRKLPPFCANNYFLLIDKHYWLHKEALTREKLV